MGTAGAKDPASALSEVLADRPKALVAAIGDDGLFVPLPPSIPIEGRAVVDARAATDIIEPGDRELVIEAWEAVLDGRYSCTEVPLPGLEGPAAMHFFDVRDEHGAYVLVIDAGEDPPPVGPVATPDTTGMAKVVRVRKDGIAVLQEVDATVTEVLGWKPDELVGRRSLDLIHPDDHELAITAWMDMLAGRGTTTRARLRHLRQDGGWTWLDISNHNRLDGTAGHVECEMVDVSDEVHALEALQAREQLLGRLTEAMSVGVFHIDADRRLLLTNPALHEILGTTAGDPLDVLAACVVDPLAVDRALNAVLAGADVDIELDARPVGSDELRHLTISARALVDDDHGVVGAVGCVTDVTESVRLRDELARRATVDELTGCLNRASVIEELERVLAGESDVAVVFVDMDGFKDVNDRDGHAAGDVVLQAIGSRLRGAVRDHDHVGRMGGDEFIAVCTGLDDVAGAEDLRDRIAATLGDPVGYGGRRIDISASVGMAWSPAGEHIDADALVARADAAMYQVKSARGAGR